ncbi:MAG TPA: hypothetical protein VNN80_02095 [Polyangiaceae bacterium]|nr:hypothetical protein [Polyangiaceae bacterium]
MVCQSPALLRACAVCAMLLGTRASSAQVSSPRAPEGDTAPGANAPGASEATPNASDDDSAIRLFREGRALLNKGRFSEACERFQASLELRRSPGTLLNVANCIQAKGDLIGALRAFEESEVLARAESDERKSVLWSTAAREEIDALTPRIPRLVVGAPAEQGVEVTLDGERISAFGEPRVLNPGEHRLLASSAGKRDFEQRITLAEGQSLSVDVPPLEPVPAAAPAAPSAASQEAASGGPSRLLPWVLVGVGGAVLTGGVVTGVVAAQRASDLESDCPNHVCEEDLSQRDEAFDTAVVADVLMGVGLVATVAGVTWLVLTPDEEGAASLSGSCDLHGCSASLRGRF